MEELFDAVRNNNVQGVETALASGAELIEAEDEARTKLQGSRAAASAQFADDVILARGPRAEWLPAASHGRQLRRGRCTGAAA